MNNEQAATTPAVDIIVPVLDRILRGEDVQFTEDQAIAFKQALIDVMPTSAPFAGASPLAFLGAVVVTLLRTKLDHRFAEFTEAQPRH